jgi:hypothetical protein
LGFRLRFHTFFFLKIEEICLGLCGGFPPHKEAFPKMVFGTEFKKYCFSKKLRILCKG